MALKEKLIERIKQKEDVQLLEALYTILTQETEKDVYQPNQNQITAIEEAVEHYRNGENSQEKVRLEEYIDGLVASGEYLNSREVIKDALSLHQRYRERAIEDLRKEIALGWDGPDSAMTMDEIIESLKKS